LGETPLFHLLTICLLPLKTAPLYLFIATQNLPRQDTSAFSLLTSRISWAMRAGVFNGQCPQFEFTVGAWPNKSGQAEFAHLSGSN
jgi:hypothetical protein